MLPFVLLLFLLSGCTSSMLNCNEAVCGPIVSKCMLTQSCKCEPKNSTCSRDCFHCLDNLFSNCCSCVEMCKNKEDEEENLSQKSHVELLSEPIEQLFSALTEEKDRLMRWVSYTFPSRTSFITHTNDKEIRITAATIDKTSILEDVELNCTVLFMTECLPFNKCKTACQSMGATSYRWFHDGCCECVGSTCFNFGIHESRCTQCPPKEDSDSATGSEGEEVASNKAGEDDEDSGDGLNLEKEHPKEEATENTAIIDNLQSVE